MGDIILDESGDVRSGIVYQFNVHIDEEVYGHDRTWVVSRLMPSSDELFLSGVRDKDTWLWVDEGGDLAGGARLSEFIANTIERVICPASFLQRLHSTPFRGYSATPYLFAENQSGHPSPASFDLWFRGLNCTRPEKVINGPDACYKCGHDPLVDVSGEVPLHCPHCNVRLFVPADLHEGAKDPRFRKHHLPAEGDVLDGSRWDGSDFIGGRHKSFITRRVLDWLLSIHAAPFQARPARICVDGMTGEQLRQLDQAIRAIG